MKDTVRLHIPDCPADLHAKIKAAAALSGIPLKQWILDACKEKLLKGKLISEGR